MYTYGRGVGGPARPLPPRALPRRSEHICIYTYTYGSKYMYLCIYIYIYVYVYMYSITNIPNFEVTCLGHLTLKCTEQAMTYPSNVPSQQGGILGPPGCLAIASLGGSQFYACLFARYI